MFGLDLTPQELGMGIVSNCDMERNLGAEEFTSSIMDIPQPECSILGKAESESNDSTMSDSKTKVVSKWSWWPHQDSHML